MKFVADRGKPCPYGLMYFSNLITTESSNIFANLLGGSKPPPYTIDIISHSQTTVFSLFLVIYLTPFGVIFLLSQK